MAVLKIVFPPVGPAAERFRVWAVDKRKALPDLVRAIQRAAASGDAEAVELAAWHLGWLARDALEIVATLAPEWGQHTDAMWKIMASEQRMMWRERRLRRLRADGGHARARNIARNPDRQEAHRAVHDLWREERGKPGKRSDTAIRKAVAARLRAKGFRMSESTVRRILGKKSRQMLSK